MTSTDKEILGGLGIIILSFCIGIDIRPVAGWAFMGVSLVLVAYFSEDKE